MQVHLVVVHDPYYMMMKNNEEAFLLYIYYMMVLMKLIIHLFLDIILEKCSKLIHVEERGGGQFLRGIGHSKQLVKMLEEEK